MGHDPNRGANTPAPEWVRAIPARGLKPPGWATLWRGWR